METLEKDGIPILSASICTYNNGPLRFQIGPRYWADKEGKMKEGKVGRLSHEEITWLLGLNVVIEAKFAELASS